MANPFRSIQYLPWVLLFQSAGVTILISALIEFLILQLATLLSGLTLGDTGKWLFGIFFGVLLPLLLAVGLGALALVVAAKLFQQIPLRRDTMWALVVCVLVLLPLKNFLINRFIIDNPFSVGLDVVTMLLVAVGLFSAGRRYWRY